MHRDDVPICFGRRRADVDDAPSVRLRSRGARIIVSDTGNVDDEWRERARRRRSSERGHVPVACIDRPREISVTQSRVLVPCRPRPRPARAPLEPPERARSPRIRRHRRESSVVMSAARWSNLDEAARIREEDEEAREIDPPACFSLPLRVYDETEVSETTRIYERAIRRYFGNMNLTLRSEHGERFARDPVA